MKPRHAASVILVSWIMIMPPLTQDRQLVENAPLSQWQTMDSFDTATACRGALAKLTAVVAGNVVHSVIERRVLAGKCLAADDPRLHSDDFEVH